MGEWSIWVGIAVVAVVVLAAVLAVLLLSRRRARGAMRVEGGAADGASGCERADAFAAVGADVWAGVLHCTRFNPTQMKGS